MPLQRIAIGIEYDGSAFFGWQAQAHRNTVQDVLESALAQIAGHPIRLHCAGRTDTGVHALGQVAHFDTPVARPLSAWTRGANAHLPGAVAVRWADQVADDFHARFSAVSRRYRYLLLNRPTRPALLAGRVGWYHRPLDAQAMAVAAKQLVGQHDFSAFRSSECQARSPIKTLSRLDVARYADCLVFDLEADGFLHHMVRNVIGALLPIGTGDRSPDSIATLRDGRDRTKAPPTFAAAGLYFVGPTYDPCHGLPNFSHGDAAVALGTLIDMAPT